MSMYIMKEIGCGESQKLSVKLTQSHEKARTYICRSDIGNALTFPSVRTRCVQLPVIHSSLQKNEMLSIFEMYIE